MNRPETYASVLEHFARYVDAVDRADFDEVLRYLGGAPVIFGALTLSDPEEIRAAYAGRHPAPAPDGRRSVTNHASNLVLSGPDADGVWTATMYYLRMETGPQGIVVATSRRLEQRIVRDGDAWRVLRLMIIADL